ncbi:MAG: hypothetical protein HS116_14760 [Planctomycetes bacterium]|nr:hypothetical protein [Planctomycetota bacterium]
MSNPGHVAKISYLLLMVAIASLLGCKKKTTIEDLESRFPIQWESDRAYYTLSSGIKNWDASVKQDYYLQKAKTLDASRKSEFGDKRRRFSLLVEELFLAEEWEVMRHLHKNLPTQYQERIWGALADFSIHEAASRRLLESFFSESDIKKLTTKQLIFAGFIPETWPRLVNASLSDETMPTLRAMALEALMQHADDQTLLSVKVLADSKDEVYMPGNTLGDVYRECLERRRSKRVKE